MDGEARLTSYVAFLRAVKAALSAKLATRAERPVEVFVQTATKLATIFAASPFPAVNLCRHLVYFYETSLLHQAQCPG